MTLLRPFQLLSVFFRDPAEFRERVLAFADSRLEGLWIPRPAYQCSPRAEALANLERFYGCDVAAILREPELAQIEAEVRASMDSLPSHAPFGRFHHGDFELARLCYVAVRCLRPATLIETGVCYGVTSAFLLQAVARNGEGQLHSIDLPPLGAAADDFVGIFIPQRLRPGWRLHRGTSRKVLPALLAEIGSLDFFIHDSLHTYRNMKLEMELVAPRLRAGGILMSDDIEGNAAYAEWVRRHTPAYSAILQEHGKNNLLGIAFTALLPETRCANGNDEIETGVRTA